ncbi:thrombin-like enzyme acutin [Hermetia illucens]|uniref:thrombin-like enzyme acutin n=1 Tax=Hermetia illucens TaxID=343691 RepID=UPI0018CC577A|nr:thrombin-like enzyme acutin [Hermetia illucens]
MESLPLLSTLITFSILSPVYADSPSIRVVNGTEAKLGQFPFAVAIVQNYGTGRPICTGSLITPKNVLTAAHCFRTSDVVKRRALLAGETSPYRPSSEKPPPSKQLRKIASVTNHPQAFDKGGNTDAEFDVGVLGVEEPFILSSNVATISIAKRALDNLSLCIALGFGRNVDGPDGVEESNRKLYYGEFTVNSRKCDSEFWKKTTYCIYSSQRITHHGDSGGPLIGRYGWQNYQYGINSAAIRKPDYKATIYTNAVFHREWIMNNIDLGYRLRESGESGSSVITFLNLLLFLTGPSTYISFNSLKLASSGF